MNEAVAVLEKQNERLHDVCDFELSTKSEPQIHLHLTRLPKNTKKHERTALDHPKDQALACVGIDVGRTRTYAPEGN